ncbi:hypothetical protein ACH5RR_041543 [Cinchona calisaya]|uniref:Uncharacterized protein n=1 Tax=Cinchona calisaya TaxID=153742 RepID=A0ABD2XVN7_9GENT
MDKKRSKLEVKAEILVEKLIKPSSTIPNHLQTFKLSFCDQLVHPSYATLLYYYSADHETVNDTAIDEVSKRLKNLQESLSDVLTCFHPPAGRLVSNEGDFHYVDCQDQGVLYREARLNCQLNEFMEAAYEDLDLITSLAPRKVFRDVDLAEVVTAFLWSRLIRALQARHGYLWPCMTSILMNLKGKKTALEFHENSFGNVYIPVPTKFIPDNDQIKDAIARFHAFD